MQWWLHVYRLWSVKVFFISSVVPGFWSDLIFVCDLVIVHTRWNKQNNVTKYAVYNIVYLPHKFVVTKNIELKKISIILEILTVLITSPEMVVTWKKAFPVLLVGCNLSWQPCRVACKCLPIRTSYSNNSPSTSRSTATSRRGNMKLSCYSIKVRSCDIVTNCV